MNLQRYAKLKVDDHVQNQLQEEREAERLAIACRQACKYIPPTHALIASSCSGLSASTPNLLAATARDCLVRSYILPTVNLILCYIVNINVWLIINY